MKRRTPINAHIVGLGVDAFLKMLLVDNFVHTDLHPGNILFRAVPHRHAAKQQQQQQQRVKQQDHHHHQQQQQQQQGNAVKVPQLAEQQQGRRRFWQFWRPRSNSSSSSAAAGSSKQDLEAAAAAPEQWELELQQMIGQQQRRWASKHAQPGADSSSGTNARLAAAAAAASPVVDDAALLLEQQLAGGSSSSGQPALEAQVVLLDFGLAEQLTDEVRHHFISFLNAISAGDGLRAARHLLRWSHTQACEDPRGFTSDVMDLFSDRCHISSEAGIDLDAVMKAVLGLARKWGVSIDSCYASLVISVCVLVGFAQALDPGVNIIDAVSGSVIQLLFHGERQRRGSTCSY
jgi:predicted unusual protein kinase regulating ubiquinone biosynthesis (AarF/ABC1/UbiB family)